MANKNYKETIWSKLDINDCEILNIAHNENGSIKSVLIKHQLLKLPRWFNMSQKNNLYSMLPTKQKNVYDSAFIIKNWREVLRGGDNGDL